MHEARNQFSKAKLQIIGISYDTVDILKKFTDDSDLTFELLADPDSKTIKDYRLHFQKGLAAPATIVIGQDGKVAAKLREDGYRKRHTAEALLETAKMMVK